MGNLPIRIYGYNNEHDVIVYTVVNDTQSECGQPRHQFQKSPFWSVQTVMQSWVSSLHFLRVENAGVVKTIGVSVAKVMSFKTKMH